MEVLACLWSYDNRWMFEKEFTKGAWLGSFCFQVLISLTCFLMVFFNQEMGVWIGFRMMLSIGTAYACLVLYVSYNSKAKEAIKVWKLENYVAVLGIFNLLMTWNLSYHTEKSQIFRYCANFHMASYFFALAPAILIIVGFFLVKIYFLILSVVSPRRLVKVRV